MQVNYDMRVTANSGLNIRTGPNIGYRRIGGMVKGTLVHCTETQGGWYKHDRGGWSCGDWLTLVRDYGSTSSTTAVQSKPVEELPPMSDYEKQLLNSLYATVDTSIETIDSIRYLYGAPLQFTETTDPRPEGSELGRTYMETLLNDMSMLVLTPGKSAFMPNFGKRATQTLLTNILGSTRNEDESKSLRAILEGKEVGRYYTFESDYAEYIKYVNNMCRISAQLLGIGDRNLFDGAKPYSQFDWDLGNVSQTGSSKLFSFLTIEKSVAFFIDGKQSSFNDGMSNSTDSSLLAGALGKTSDFAKEALFLFGKGYQDEAIMDTSKVNYENAVQKVVSKLTSNDSLATQLTDRISDHAATLINGGNIAFPEIWKDSSYNKSYDISLKLISPYGDVESFYLYILVPLWHLVALSYPRQLGANGYLNPFLVRAFCKGWFNCTMGLVDSISIRRASQDGWATAGYPTEVDVTLSIKDLYENLTISRTGDYSTFHNTEYMDMIATWCGVNMNKPELQRKFNLYEAFTKNKFKELFPNITDQIHQDITNKIRKYIK